MKKTLVNEFLEKEGHSASYLICSEFGSTDCSGNNCPLEKYCQMRPERKMTEKQYREWRAYIDRLKEETAKQVIETYLNNPKAYDYI